MANTPPTITSVEYDQESYAEGDAGHVTVGYTRGSSDSSTSSQWVATDTVTNLTGTMTQTFSVSKPNLTNVAGTDDDGRVYTLEQDDGVGTATFSFTA